jgi:hypothetical protein
MKKKIINGFLMVALLAATVTSFVSCKDNDEDVKTDLIAQMGADYTNLLNKYIAADQALQTLLEGEFANADATLKSDLQTWVNSKDYATHADVSDSVKKVKQWVNDQGYLKSVDFPTTLSTALAGNTQYQQLLQDLYGEAGENNGLADQLNDLKKRMDDAETDIDDLQKRVKALEDRLDAVEKAIEKLQEDFKNLITSVNVNATSTTLLSNSKIFPGLNVQFVGAAFGQAVTTTGAFPSTETDLNGNKLDANYINITEGEAYEWNNGIINNEDYNAGKVYFTVNPSNVSENVLNNAVTLTLTNSQNNKDNDGEPIVRLDNVKKSNKVLTWGTTRGESQVTLFEADATYDMTKANAIDPTKMIDFNSIKNNFVNIINAAKSITRENDQFKETTSAAAKTTIQETAKAVATLLNAKIPHLPALALKAEWTDNTVGTRNVISDYSLAATAYKPLSFNFGKEVGDGLPTISLDKIDNAVFNFAKKFKNTIDDFKTKVSDTNLNFSFDLSGLDPSKFNVKKTIYVFVRTGEKTAKDAENKDVNVVTIEKIYFSTEEQDPKAKGYIDIHDVENFAANKVYFTSVSVGEDLTSEVKKIKDAVNKGVDTSDIENLLADAVKALDNVNKSIDNVTDLVDLTTDYLESIVNGAINFVNKGGIARALEPVLLANTKNGIVRATGSYEAGEYTFVPTTMTYEIVAPAFKKYIAIVDKTGKARFGKVLTKGDNDFSAVKLTLQQDDVKLIYAAMDFTGRQIIKEYDITVE